jgi:hypothetical protein
MAPLRQRAPGAAQTAHHPSPPRTTLHRAQVPPWSGEGARGDPGTNTRSGQVPRIGRGVGQGKGSVPSDRACQLAIRARRGHLQAVHPLVLAQGLPLHTSTMGKGGGVGPQRTGPVLQAQRPPQELAGIYESGQEGEGEGGRPQTAHQGARGRPPPFTHSNMGSKWSGGRPRWRGGRPRGSWAPRKGTWQAVPARQRARGVPTVCNLDVAPSRPSRAPGSHPGPPRAPSTHAPTACAGPHACGEGTWRAPSPRAPLPQGPPPRRNLVPTSAL